MNYSRISLATLMFASVLALAGCGSGQGIKSGNGGENGTGSTENYKIKEYSFQDKIKKADRGMSYGQYNEDYGFEGFLRQGGASSDEEVVGYLASNVFAQAKNLSFAKELYGCSTLSAETLEGEHLFGRNFDWEKCDALILKSAPENGYASLATVNTDFIKEGAGLASAFLSEEQQLLAALYAPLDGMNEQGFCVSVNMISDGDSIGQNSDKPDLTTTTAVRLLLNQAADVEEAISLLEQYDMHSSMGMMVHFALADREGNSVVVEYINNEMIVTETKVVTNFYLAAGEKYGIGTEQSHQRYDLLMERVKDQKLSMAEVVDALDRVSKDNFEDTATTEWSIVFNQDTLSAQYFHRENYEEGYEFSLEAEKK